jgi:cytochrome b6-f complex iron-sulfur subunit
MQSTSRRDFLKLTRQALLWASTGLGLGGLISYLDYDPYPAPQTEFDLGPTQQYPPGSRTLLPEIPAILLNTDEGFTALSLVCTHLGCTLENDGGSFQCPCHGSHFNGAGEVTHGPATNPLRILRLEITDENRILLYTDDAM